MSTTIGALSSAGIGSGLDVNSIVSQLMSIERQPLTKLQTQEKAVQAQISSFGKIQSALSSLGDAARALYSDSTWSAAKATSADPTALAVTATSASATGDHSVSVTKLASAQTVVGGILPGPTYAPGTGSLSISMIQSITNPTDPTPTSGASQVRSITVDVAQGDSLDTIRDKINAKNSAFSASVITQADGSKQLAIRSKETGEQNAFKIEATVDQPGDGGHDLSMFAFDPTGAVAQAFDPKIATAQMVSAASNAQATIDGIPVSSATNEIKAIDGMTIKALKVSDAPIAVSVARDDEDLKKKVNDFATAYNGLVKLVRDQTANDPNGTKGALAADRTAVGLLSSLRGIAGGSTGASSAFGRLAQIGLDPQSDGTLKVNDTKLTAALGNATELKKFFAADNAGTANDGFGRMIKDFVDSRTGTDGLLTAKTDGLNRRVKAMQKQEDHLNDRMDLVEARLRAQYTKLDQTMGQMSGLMSYVNRF